MQNDNIITLIGFQKRIYESNMISNYVFKKTHTNNKK